MRSLGVPLYHESDPTVYHSVRRQISTNGSGFVFKGVVHLAFLHVNAVLSLERLLQLRHVAAATISTGNKGIKCFALGTTNAQCNRTLAAMALGTPVVTNVLEDSHLPWGGFLVPFNAVALKLTTSWRFGTLLWGFLTHATKVQRSSAVLSRAILLSPRRLADDATDCLCRHGYVSAVTGLNSTLC